MLKRIKSFIRKWYFKYYSIFRQGVFLHKEQKVNYIYKSKKSETLIVILSAFTPKNVKGRYNYISTLNKIDINQLFILDRYGYDERGAYYLGSNGELNILEAVKALIDQTVKRAGVNKIVFVGSSKGGYASLLLATYYKNSDVISGAPQYFLGTYLKESDNLATLRYVMGDETSESILHLDSILKGRIMLHTNNMGRVYLLYSDEEHTYEEHIKHMIDDLRTSNVEVILHKVKFSNHSDVGRFFPDYLKETIKKEYL